MINYLFKDLISGNTTSFFLSTFKKIFQKPTNIRLWECNNKANTTYLNQSIALKFKKKHFQKKGSCTFCLF